MLFATGMRADPMDQSATVRYAGFWRRVGAFFIDRLLLTLLAGLLLGPALVNAPLWSGAGLLLSAFALLLTVALWVCFLGTPGKLLLGCQVVDAASHAPLTVRQAVLRYLAYLVSTLPLMLGFLWIARDAHKQGFHDKIARSVVLLHANIEADDESSKSLQQLMGELR
jgi:uncharacterized RDD family membrane protein YckC